MTTVARRATVEDVPELMRLRVVLRVSSGDPRPEPGEWEAQTEADLRERLPELDGDLAVFVVDRPGGGGLAAGAFGVIHQLLGMPHRPDGRRGWISDVVTEPEFRRQGFATTAMTALVDWFRESGVSEVQLNATDEGAQLYERLGFERKPDPTYRLRLTPRG